jgi:enoyl-CoA hydratase/carnithine racemase
VLITATQPPVWTAIFSAEDRRNALTRAMVADLGDLIRRLAADDQAGLLVLRGASDVAFCAGVDVKEMAGDLAGQPFAGHAMPVRGQPGCPKPMVAMLNGDAVGGGLQLALSCDIIVAHTDVRAGCRRPSWAPCSGMASWRGGPGRRGRRFGPDHHRRTSG